MLDKKFPRSVIVIVIVRVIVIVVVIVVHVEVRGQLVQQLEHLGGRHYLADATFIIRPRLVSTA